MEIGLEEGLRSEIQQLGSRKHKFPVAFLGVWSQSSSCITLPSALRDILEESASGWKKMARMPCAIKGVLNRRLPLVVDSGRD